MKVKGSWNVEVRRWSLEEKRENGKARAATKLALHEYGGCASSQAVLQQYSSRLRQDYNSRLKFMTCIPLVESVPATLDIHVRPIQHQPPYKHSRDHSLFMIVDKCRPILHSFDGD